jgi:hypothetical protein
MRLSLRICLRVKNRTISHFITAERQRAQKIKPLPVSATSAPWPLCGEALTTLSFQ